ncbi:MAG: SpoIIE family protein phosphatase [Acidobacteria bacterium]|nr:SpoIIE family protein phosphatase [Acidobacteriota bacterium]
MASARLSLPQASLDMLVLQAVAAGPMHGFAIMQRLEQLSAEVVRFPRASLYPALHRLETRRLIAGDWKPAQGGREAKFYQVTAAGRARLQGEAGWELLSKAVGHLATLEQEMRTAAAIQRALLPNTHRAGSFFDAAAAAEPCRSIGGDFFDYIDLPAGALGFVLGDVAGKGPPAALLAALMQGSLVAQAHAGTGPAATVAAVNTAIVRRGIQGRFVTLFYGVLRPDGSLAYCNAGHNPPILARADGSVCRLDVGGMVLGVFGDAPFVEGSQALGPGDHLVLFSDGVSEAMNEAEEEFGDERLLACLASLTGDAEQRLQHILAAVRQFTGDAPQHDDVTAMVVSYRSSAR